MTIRFLPFVAAAAASILYAFSAQAGQVNKVQLGIKVAKSGACPRVASVKMWAHTSGPGIVKFVIHGRSGSKTGQFSTNAVKGPSGNYLATSSRNVTISTDTKTGYRVEVVGTGKFSNWVPLVAECGPKPRTKTKTTASNAKPKAKKAADVGKPQPRTTTKTTGSKSKPPVKKASKGGGKPASKPANSGSKSKPTTKPTQKKIASCKATLFATRYGSYTKKGGIATARVAWRNSSHAKYGLKWRYLNNAQGRKETCKRKKGIYICTVSARPCKA